MTFLQIAACAIFFVAYVCFASERVDKAVAALAGAALMLLVGVLTQQEAFHGTEVVRGVDWNTIFLLIGMMIVVAITRETGVFEWLAIKSAKIARGRPMALIAMVSLVTAVVSALLDNVTTVLLIAPVVLIICRTLELDPVPYLICCAVSSNIGGTATLIGDPPNIMIGSAAGLTFIDFLRVDLPIVAVAFLAYLGVVRLTFGRRLKVSEANRLKLMEFDESKAIHDRPLLNKCLFVIVLALAGFTIHGWVGLQPATIALSAAGLLLLLYRKSPVKVLESGIEWPTIFFFIGVFIMVGGLVKVGVVGRMADGALSLTGGHAGAMTMLVMWFGAFFSGIVGNIPATVTIISLVTDMAHSLHGSTSLAALHAPNVLPLWWALSLGACLGGNLTLVGAPANVLVVAIAAGSGYRISFVQYLKHSVPLTLATLVVAAVALWLVFLR
jgi:Na+/H+ antiporter NhaD/arsenite permease-like protein